MIRRNNVRFGLNYVPSDEWYYCWNEWREESISCDLDDIASLDVDHIRVQLIWPWFQPNPTYISSTHLERLSVLLDLAKQRKLDVVLCPLTGFLSGYRFLPPNVSGDDVFCSESVFDQIKLFITTLLTNFEERTNFIGIDLGNEINVLALKLNLEQGDSWGRKLISLIGDCTTKFIVNGVDHNPWFNGRTFSLRHLANDYDLITLHCWPKFTGCLEVGPLDGLASTNLAAFMTELAISLNKTSAPIWIQEFGCSSDWGNAVQQESYMRKTVSAAISSGATWFTWWCSHDIDRKLAFDSLEYDLGLFTCDHKLKPLASVYKDLISQYQSLLNREVNARRPPSHLFLPEYQSTVSKDLPESQFIQQNFESSTWPLFKKFLAAKK